MNASPVARLLGTSYRGDTFSMTGASIGTIVRFAYGIGPLTARPFATLEGEPRWSERFDIIAKTPGQLTLSRTVEGPIHLMMQSLLDERFGLRVHWQKRERDGYALVLATSDGSLGPRIQPSNVDCDLERARSSAAIAAGTAKPAVLGVPRERPTCGASAGPKHENGRDVPFTMEVLIGSQPLSALAEVLSLNLGRPVVDRSGLDGSFDIELRFAPERRAAALPDVSSPDSPGSPSLPAQFDPGWPWLDDALRDQLGLRLQPARVPVDVLVIDSVRLPTEN